MKVIRGLGNLIYVDMLMELGLLSLKRGCEEGNLITVYLKGSCRERCRVHRDRAKPNRLRLLQGKFCLGKRKQFFTIRTVKHWSKLSGEEALKESFLKAVGVGIGFNLQRIEFNVSPLQLEIGKVYKETKMLLDGDKEEEWMFEEIRLDDHHHVAVALGKQEEFGQKHSDCLYTSAHGMGNKHDELEICVELQGYNFVGIMDGSHGWSVAIKGVQAFQEGQAGKMRRGELPFCVREQLKCMELCLGMDKELAEGLWVRIKERVSQGDIIVGVCYMPPDQKVDQALYRQIASYVQGLILMGDLNHCNICWRDTAGHKQSRRLLESIDNNLLLQVIEDPMRRDALLDLVLATKEALVGDVNVKASLGCSDHEMMEFRILGTGRSAHNPGLEENRLWPPQRC
ncbi:hypothetical protein QYF61_000539 [Mycteria americana]|uniref:Endonuclease/exonuclease/phosphatase domain-containing protein n=1 Tax=Mycteria americana TaxID=33587 RepID=A0AAN7NPN2_MYCAM|nr:hypothetical protein QYF61_000539 [Mycteria americana]